MTDPFSYLFALEHFGIKFGLGNIEAIVESLGHPERAFRSAHIAGTNGKGSVTAMVATALQAAGHHTGRYTSPHLVALNERFVVDGQPVDTEALARTIEIVRTQVDRLRASGGLDAHPTFFEVTTAVAFELFREAEVEVAVLEVGLGGRLDATNVVAPLVTAITSLALDHQVHLGRTLGEIAVEKAGIIKPGVPVVVGDLAPDALVPIGRVADERGAPLVVASDGVRVTRLGRGTPTRVRVATPVRDYGEVTLGLAGDHQIGNAVVAVRLLETLDRLGVSVSAQAIVHGLSAVRWPGRLEVRRWLDGREAILDAAHNPEGAAALAAFLRADNPKRPMVFAAMRDKDVDGMLAPLLPEVASLIVTRASNPRATEPRALAGRARRLAPALPITIADDPAAALAAAWRESPRIVVAGSIFLLGDVFRELGPS